VGSRSSFYDKFINTNNEFLQSKNSFGHLRFSHEENINSFEHKLTQSFVHIVSETLATSYMPYVTEKFLYSVLTRGLFVTYGQPGWQNYIENRMGFRSFTKIFDYRFDTITDPVERLLELTTMLSKFQHLSVHDWHDLYHMEAETIEYNYDHYCSRRYHQCLLNSI
jgi:hypothetical protein